MRCLCTVLGPVWSADVHMAEYYPSILCMTLPLSGNLLFVVSFYVALAGKLLRAEIGSAQVTVTTFLRVPAECLPGTPMAAISWRLGYLSHVQSSLRHTQGWAYISIVECLSNIWEVNSISRIICMHA